MRSHHPTFAHATGRRHRAGRQLALKERGQERLVLRNEGVALLLILADLYVFEKDVRAQVVWYDTLVRWRITPEQTQEGRKRMNPRV